VNPNSFADVAMIRALLSVKRRWKLAAQVFGVMMSLTLLLVLLLPSKYVSHLKVLVKNERANSMINTSDQTQGVVYLNDVSEAQISTEIELLTSADLLRQVVRKCDLTQFVSKRVTDPEKREEIAVADLRKALTIAAEHRSNVIGIAYSSKDPKLSAHVLQTLSELYLASHLALHGAPGSYEFFDKMWKDASAQLNSAEQDLAAFRENQHIVSLPEEKNILLQHMAGLQGRLAESRASAEKSEQEASSYQTSISHMSSSIEKERKSIPNQSSIEQLSTLLVTLQNKRAELVTRYQPEDRIIQELNKQIELTQSALDKAKQSPSQEVASGTNPTFQSAEENYVRANAAHAGNLAEANSLNSEIRVGKQRLAQMSNITASYDDLVRRRDELAKLRETYRKNRDEAYIGQSLDTQKLANVAVVETPIPEKLSTQPKKPMILAVGFFWSLLCGLIAAVLAELSAPRVRSTYELQQAVSVPLLAAVPQNAPLSFVSEEFPELYLAMQRTIFTPQAQLETR
jgi:uncharacterized protein involved in exopolysaccharide biosynthesis